MKKKLSVKISIFLALHTAIVILFVSMAIRGGILPDGLLPATGIAIFSALLTAYTVYKISGIVSHEIAAGMSAVCKSSACLMALSEKLYDNAKALERRAVLVTAYADSINGLVKSMDSSDNGASREKSTHMTGIPPTKDVSGHKPG